MSDRPSLPLFLCDPFLREPDEITDSEEAFYPTQETPVDPNRRLPDGSDYDEEEQGVLPSEEEKLVDETGENAPSNQDRPEQDDSKSNDDQQIDKLEGEDGGTPPANATAEEQEETLQKADTKLEMRSGLKRSASIVNGLKDEKRSVSPAAPTEVPPHGGPDGSSTRGEERGK